MPPLLTMLSSRPNPEPWMSFSKFGNYRKSRHYCRDKIQLFLPISAMLMAQCRLQAQTYQASVRPPYLIAITRQILRRTTPEHTRELDYLLLLLIYLGTLINLPLRMPAVRRFI